MTKNNMDELFINFIIDNIEGGYVNNESDSGGPTNYGITIYTYAKWLKLPALHATKWMGKEDFDYMTKRIKSEIANRKNGGQKKGIISEDIKMLKKSTAINIYLENYLNPTRTINMGATFFLFDFGVNAGPITAIKSMQRAIGVKPDGVIGPITNEALKGYGPLLLAKLINERHRYYCDVVNYKRENIVFLKPWANRISLILKFIMDNNLMDIWVDK